MLSAVDLCSAFDRSGHCAQQLGQIQVDTAAYVANLREHDELVRQSKRATDKRLNQQLYVLQHPNATHRQSSLVANFLTTNTPNNGQYGHMLRSTLMGTHRFTCTDCWAQVKQYCELDVATCPAGGHKSLSNASGAPIPYSKCAQAQANQAKNGTMFAPTLSFEDATDNNRRVSFCLCPVCGEECANAVAVLTHC